MAKGRYINTEFWRDDYTTTLDQLEQHLFLYFLTNPSTNILGIYHLPLNYIRLDTGHNIEKLELLMGRFERDNKIVYSEGWVVVKNWIKNQALNPFVVKGIERTFNELPPKIRRRLTDENDKLYIGHESLLIATDIPNLNSNLTLTSTPTLTLTYTGPAGAKTNLNANGRKRPGDSAAAQLGILDLTGGDEES